MTTQTEAQRLIAEWNDAWLKPINPTKYARAGGKMATELLRLESANAELLEAIKAEMHSAWDCVSYHPKMHAAIAKHGGQS